MRPRCLPLVLAGALAACGKGGQARQAAPPGPAPTSKAAPLPGFNLLIGVWARVSGARCRFGDIQFTATQMTAEPAAGGAMATTPVTYDLSAHGAPVARPATGAPIRFRVIDADHLGDDTDCVLARAD